MHLSPRGKENSDVMLFCCEKKRLQQPTRPTVSTDGRSQHIKYIHLNPLTLPDGSVRPAALCHFSMFYFSFQINSSSERDQSQDEGPRFWFCRDRQNVFEVVFSSLCHRRRKKDSERQKKKKTVMTFVLCLDWSCSCICLSVKNLNGLWFSFLNHTFNSPSRVPCALPGKLIWSFCLPVIKWFPVFQVTRA